MGANLLDVSDLTVGFTTDEGSFRAAEGVSFSIAKGEVVGLVGESGCGKSVTAMSLLRLVPSPPGRIESGRALFNGEDLLTMPVDRLRAVRGAKIGMIFQEPMTALSPLHRVGDQLVETLRLHRDVSTRDARRVALEWLTKVGLPDPAERMFAWPFQLSGGQRQRVMIAMALMLDPELIIADEPTTALDVTIQAQIFELMMRMKSRDASVLLITHDMGVVWEQCDRVLVMYASQIVEEGALDAIFKNPAHPYTQGLLRSMAVLAPVGASKLPSIPGQVPSPLRYPHGCRFADRCPLRIDRCSEQPPMIRTPGGKAACWLVKP